MRERNSFKFKIFYPIIIGSFLFFSFNFARAESYSVAPSIIDLKAEARDIIKKSVTITNDGEEKVDLYPTVNNILVDESGLQKFETIFEADKATSLASWIQFPRGVIEIEPGEIKTIVFSIQVNLEAIPGIYHARISFPSGPTRYVAEEKINEGPFVTINLEVIEKVNELLGLKKFVSDKILFLNLPASFIYSIENIGNKEIAPKGEVIIYDRKGKEVGNMAVNIEGKKILPGNVLDLKSEFEKGSYFGKYKAFLNIKYGGSQKGTINDTVYFYIIPWQKLLMVFTVTIVFAWMLSVWIHKRRSHESHAPVDHLIFHARNLPSRNHIRSNRSDFYDKLEGSVSNSRRLTSVNPGRNHNHITVNNKHKKDHGSQHGHIMDLRNPKKK